MNNRNTKSLTNLNICNIQAWSQINLSAIVLYLFAVSPALSETTYPANSAGLCTKSPCETRTKCSFNKGNLIPVGIIDYRDKFKLIWADGPQMTYKWRDAEGPFFLWNIIDSLGGKWHKDEEYKGSLRLGNLDNGNEIECL